MAVLTSGPDLARAHAADALTNVAAATSIQVGDAKVDPKMEVIKAGGVSPLIALVQSEDEQCVIEAAEALYCLAGRLGARHSGVSSCLRVHWANQSHWFLVLEFPPNQFWHFHNPKTSQRLDRTVMLFSCAGCEQGQQGIKQAGGTEALNGVVQKGKRKEIGEKAAKAAKDALMRVL